MKIAIVGAGISGLGCARRLHAAGHDIAVFESGPRIGGHTATYDVKLGARRYAIDTGFIVYNDWTYPEFIALIDQLAVSSKPTEMGFSVCDEVSGLEYAGNNLNTLFAQRRNLVSPRFIKMVREILRFNRKSVEDLDGNRLRGDETLGDYLERNGYGDAFCNQYLIPMTSAIWSADVSDARDFPVEFFIRFFRNHGLLSVTHRPQWRVIEGGSREYLAPLVQDFEHRIRTGCPISKIQRPPSGGVDLTLPDGKKEHFDEVVIATHSDQALALLDDPSPDEKSILGALAYRDNDVVLHTDTRVLPKNRNTWSSWNYRLRPGNNRAVLTYNMNILQGIEAPETFCVTLNDTDAINPRRILGRFNYAHPQFSVEGIKAQSRWSEINGVRGTWFCGAYWRNGFHEDGLVSGLRVADSLAQGGMIAA
ncbi:amine oxidase, flavin-containing [Luminiphilus syltensis NOR5-1B]|uniref:Amine oxidase, flavin-containing n=1 Tax=Luminiphilus syltensis NOR5-1B TaxID=565045 RepID=B8KUQ9_9GAMM|nr:FAD-dependent oxidoreductase [Luminiphilus syltensis]EED34538.1 amine oxidase, flavin-containing [Luminiphilus syltensis NOR5-1B]